MQIMLFLILISLATAFLFLGAFIWANRSGQFDDLLTPALRILPDENGSDTMPNQDREDRHGTKPARPSRH